MCQQCGHKLESHYSWSSGNMSGNECSDCLYISKGIYKSTGGIDMHVFVPPKDYSVTTTPVGKGMKYELVLTSGIVAVT